MTENRDSFLVTMGDGHPMSESLDDPIETIGPQNPEKGRCLASKIWGIAQQNDGCRGPAVALLSKAQGINRKPTAVAAFRPVIHHRWLKHNDSFQFDSTRCRFRDVDLP